MAQGPTAPARPRRHRLSRDEVATTALALVDSEGIDALTMRRLADLMGVGTMTLYGYFRNKRELLGAVVAAAVDDSPGVNPTGDWRAQLRELVIGTRRMLVRHPSLVEIRTREPLVAPEAFRITERAMTILLDAGFERSDAAFSFRLLFVYSFGFAALSPARGEEEARVATRAGLEALSRQEFPSLAAVIEEAVEGTAGDAVFKFGLERILDGLDARLATGHMASERESSRTPPGDH